MKLAGQRASQDLPALLWYHKYSVMVLGFLSMDLWGQI